MKARLVISQQQLHHTSSSEGENMTNKLSSLTCGDTLSETIDHRATLYSIAAAAAGVSILALAAPAEGEVVITRKNIPIPISSYFFPPPHPVPISLNNNGVNDFSFELYTFAYHSFNDDLYMKPLEGGAVVGAPSTKGAFYASALARGARIGPSAHFSSKGFADIEVAHGIDASSNYSRKLYGNWGGNPANRYIGVKFLIDGATHYGWVRLTVITEPSGVSATITAYAYETVANKRILAGIATKDSANTQAETKAESLAQPSLGMLALGANGLALWRRDEGLSSTACS
jgi:hypothetical protein